MLSRLATAFGDHRKRLSEIGWVSFQVLFEFIINFVAIKLYTNLLGPEGYGAFSLAQTSVLFLSSIFTSPIQTAFTRYFYSAEADGSLSAATATMLKWYAGATLAVLLAGIFLAGLFHQYLGLDRVFILATSVLFVAMQWRALLVGNLVVRRQRRSAALQTVGYLFLQVLLVVSAAHITTQLGKISTTLPTAALVGYACADLVFALIAAKSMLKLLHRDSRQARNRMSSIIWTVGVPYGALLVCQTIQSFSDRFIVSAELGVAAAGLYVAAFQICGIPFSLLVAVLNNLLTPIAYQRAKNVDNPNQLWAADKILLIGICGYVILGGVGVCIYIVAGQQLLQLTTSADFLLPVQVLICLALSRYVQSAASLLQIFFSVHHKMSASLIYRIMGSLVTIPLTWWSIRHFGNATMDSKLLAAAAAGLAIGLGYIALLCFGPSGCYWLVRSNRLKI